MRCSIVRRAERAVSWNRGWTLRRSRRTRGRVEWTGTWIAATVLVKGMRSLLPLLGGRVRRWLPLLGLSMRLSRRETGRRPILVGRTGRLLVLARGTRRGRVLARRTGRGLVMALGGRWANR